MLAMHAYPAVYRCAIQSPLNRLFDYLPPQTQPEANAPVPGQRLWVPFGTRRIVALLLEVRQDSPVAPNKIRHAESFIDSDPLLDEASLDFMHWITDYYHHPLGDTIFGFLPQLLRKGRPAELVEPSAARQAWQLSLAGKGLGDVEQTALRRAPQQAKLITALQQQAMLSAADLKQQGFSTAIVRAVRDKGLIETAEFSVEVQEKVSTHSAADGEKPPSKPDIRQKAENAIQLTDEQTEAVVAIRASMDEYACFLLHGVTGSGKTEVYLRAIASCIERGEQALVLVPEIGLTPQMLARFEARFGQSVTAMHSNLTPTERLNAWLRAREGSTSVIVGTRSALLTPLPRLGLIVVDEEHDSSFKQQDGLRYSARDLAIKRAQLAAVPVILGSATPSLESLANAEQQRFNLLRLRQRAGGVELPEFHLCDSSEQAAEEGVSLRVLSAARRHLDAGAQVMVFLNRRGYAPTLLCQTCGWMAKCRACDARMTAHLLGKKLICHHCDSRASWPRSCPQCNAALNTLGSGTQKLEQVLNRHFSDYPIVRVDRDSTQRKGALERQLAIAHSGKPCILLGTQMLAKGHHFPKLAMVAIIDSDSALYSSDYRGPERLAQTITQVAGRAGRESQRGEVYLQSQMPDHPTLQGVITLPYEDFAAQLLQERAQLQLPPYSKSAALLGEHRQLEELLEHMRQLWQVASARLNSRNELSSVGPVPAALVRKANRFRAQLLLYSTQGKALHLALHELRSAMDEHKAPNGMRLALDIDPIDTN